MPKKKDEDIVNDPENDHKKSKKKHNDELVETEDVEPIKHSKKNKEDTDDEEIEEEENQELEIGKVTGEDELGEREDDEMKNCVYNSKKNDDLNELIFSDSLGEVYDESKLIKVKKEDRICCPCLTNFEFARIIGERAKQIESGAKVLVKNVGNLKPFEKALLELKFNVSPIIIKRYLPNNYYEDWELNELDKDDLIKELVSSNKLNVN
jgi:DNA-directed RNA polymerases I, II, and III subunit RPABC2